MVQDVFLETAGNKLHGVIANRDAGKPEIALFVGIGAVHYARGFIRQCDRSARNDGTCRIGDLAEDSSTSALRNRKGSEQNDHNEHNNETANPETAATVHSFLPRLGD